MQRSSYAFAEFDDCAGGGELDDAAGDAVAYFVLGDVLVDLGRDQLLHGELDLALFRVNGEN